MKEVWKFTFGVVESVRIEMPVGAKVIFVGRQGPAKPITLWVLVDPNATTEPRWFYVHGTGHPINDETAELYLGTVFDGPFVWHVFGHKQGEG